MKIKNFIYFLVGWLQGLKQEEKEEDKEKKEKMSLCLASIGMQDG